MLKPATPPMLHSLNAYNKMTASRTCQLSPRVLDDYDVEITISHCGLCHCHPTHDTGVLTSLPVIPDLGIVGTITAVGKYVMHLNVGDRVGVGAIVSACQDEPSCTTCSCDNEVLCRRLITTYGDVDDNRPRAFSGYSQITQINAHHAVKIPDALPSEAAAPLFCAGVAVYKPLKEFVQPGQVVGVVGIGALGHLALQFILALQATPVAFSTSPEKEESARWLGAEEFINMNDLRDIQRAKTMVDVLLVTSQAPDQPYNMYADWIKRGGKMIVVGLSKEELEMAAGKAVANKLPLVSSDRGSVKDTKAMLSLAAEVGVRPIVESVHTDDANDAFERLHDGKARFSVVLRSC